MSQRYLIAALFLLFAASATFLFWQNARELDPNQGKTWWTLAFADPQASDDLSFIVENHSDQTNFQYEITANKTSLAKDSFTVRKGEIVTISPAITNKSGERTNITVTLGNEKKEIYR